MPIKCDALHCALNHIPSVITKKPRIAQIFDGYNERMY